MDPRKVTGEQPATVARAASGEALGAQGVEGPLSAPDQRLLLPFLEGGSVVTAFSVFLSSRLDLVSASDANALAAVAARKAAIRATAGATAPANAFPGPDASSFAQFDAAPFDSDHLVLWHRARLPDGRSVVVKMVRDDVEDDVTRGSAALCAVRRLWRSERGVDIQSAVDEFMVYLPRALDLEREADDLERLRRDCEGLRLVVVPRVVPEACGPGRVVMEHPGSELTAFEGEAARRRAAVRLCRAWLALALGGALVPEEPSGCNVAVLADGRTAFLGGPMHRVSGRVHDSLRSYLAAATVGDEHGVASAWTGLSAAPDAVDERHLRHQIRHAEPFRDGGWSSESDRLARAIFAHWRVATSLGFEPSPFFGAVLRGLSHVVREAERLAPGANSLRDGFQAVRWRDALLEMKRLTDPEDWEEAFRRQARLITGLPRSLDRLLSAAEGESEEARDRNGGGDGHAGRVLISLLVGLGAVIVVARHLAEMFQGAGWIEGVGAALVLLIGTLALRAAAE